MVADTLSRKSQGVLASVASREWLMLKAVGQFELHYRGGTSLGYFWEFSGYAIPTK